MQKYDCWTNYCNTQLKFHAQFRKSTRKNATQAANEIGRGASRRGQFRAARVSRFCAWICEIAREFSSECCNNLSNNRSTLGEVLAWSGVPTRGGLVVHSTVMQRRQDTAQELPLALSPNE